MEDGKISYAYNADGQRISKTLTQFGEESVTTEYFYNGEILAGQKTGNDVLVFMYDNNGDIFGFTYNGKPYYYIKNAQNDVMFIVDPEEGAVVLYTYDAWGNVTGCYDASENNIGTINPITYRSYYYDFELGMYYLSSRYYMPALHRFLNADGYVQTGQGMLDKNMFAYCLNDPVNMMDPNGDAPIHHHITGGYCPICGFRTLPSAKNNTKKDSPTIDPPISFGYNSHHKKGTTNSANRETHENGESRRQRDQRGEKGDARRKPNPNKRRTQQITIYISSEEIVCATTMVVATAGVMYLIANDCTGIGVFDDVAIVPLVRIIWDTSAQVLA